MTRQATSTRSPSSSALCFRSPDPDTTRRAAIALAACASRGLVVALSGPLGAGKTAFVKGLAEGLGIDPDGVTSPTFVIAGEYEGARRLHHLDLYRLQSVSELEQAGYLDLLEPGALVAIEWADRFAGELPVDRLEIAIERVDDDARVFRARAAGEISQSALDAWARALRESGVATDRAQE